MAAYKLVMYCYILDPGNLSIAYHAYTSYTNNIISWRIQGN